MATNSQKDKQRVYIDAMIPSYLVAPLSRDPKIAEWRDIGGNQCVTIPEKTSLKLKNVDDTEEINVVTFSPDGKTLASWGAGGGILLWDWDQIRVQINSR